MRRRARALEARDRFTPGGRRDVESAIGGDAEIESLEELGVAFFGDEDLAIGVADVALEARRRGGSG